MDIVQSYSDRNMARKITDNRYTQYLQKTSPVPIDAGYIVKNNIQDVPNTEELTEAELINMDNDRGKLWSAASKVVYDAMYDGVNAITLKKPENDQDYGRFGVEFMGQFDNNLAMMGYNVAKLQNVDERTKLAMYHLMTDFGKLPDFTWNGAQRFIKGIFTDPTTYASVGSIGLGFLGRAGVKQATKESFKQILRQGLTSPYAVAALEGGGYGGLYDYFTQEVGIEAGVQDGVNLGQLAGAAGIGTVAGPAIVGAGQLAMKGGQKIAPAVRDIFDQAGEAADQRIAERARDRSVTLNAGVDPMPAIDAALSFAGRLVRKEEPIRADGGLTPNPEKAGNELRLHINRLDAAKEGVSYPGAPKNPRTLIKAPDGSGLPDVVIGQVTPDDWQRRIEKAMSPDEINEAAKWYKKVFDEFRKQSGGDPEEMAKLTDAWFAGQQNSSPSQTLNDVLFVYEQVKRGVPKDQLQGKGLPSANKIVFDILTGSEISGGAGQKISDFLDSGYGKNVRSFMNNDPMGGSPFVVDIHTARDTGLVDDTYINHLRRLGYDVPEGIVTDFGSGGIKGPMYENRALFGAQLTQHLNNQNWMGRSDWEPSEIQAIGWMQLSDMYGQSNTGGDVVSAFATNTRRISMEVDPGEGSPWADKFGADYANLQPEDKININNQVTAKAIDIVNREQGINLGQVVHGTGGWELFQNASTVQQAIASKQSAVQAAARLGLLLNQTEVWVNAPKAMTKNPKHFAVDIIEDGAETLRDSNKLRELFGAITEADPNGLFRGYQPVIIDGKPGIRILIDDTAIKNSPLTKANAQQYIMDFANKQLGEITDKLDINAQVDIMEADLTKLRNDWNKDKEGGGYKSYLSGQPGKNEISGGSVLDTDRSELENLFGELIREAKTRGGTSN